MAIDSAAKRKSTVAIGGYFLGPVVVPDGSFSVFDRQVIGYGYGGIGGVVPAGFVCTKNETLTAPTATVTMKVPYATITLKC